MPESPVRLIEFPADDAERARRFWTGLLDVTLESRTADEGEGWQTSTPGPALGIHDRGRGPGDSFSLPYFQVDDLATARFPASDAVLLVGRDGHPFRRRERAQLLALAGIADRAWTMLED